VAQDSDIACESRLLYVILTLMAWCKGRCWPGIETQAGYLGRSEDSITRYHRELESHGLLIINRSGKHNQYYPAILQGQPPRPKPQQPHHTHAGRGWSIGRIHAALTPKKEELENVKNVPVPPLPEWVEGYWDHLEGKNDENVDKSGLKQEEEASKPSSSVEPKKRVLGDTCTPGDAESTKPQYLSDVCDDQPHPVNALTVMGDSATSLPDTKKVQEKSATSGDQVRGDHLQRGKKDVPGDPGNLAVDPEKGQEKSADSVDSGHPVRGAHLQRGKNIQAPDTEKVMYPSAKNKDRGESPVRASGEHSADARTRIPKIFDTGLLREVLDLTGDYKSKGCWISCINALPEEEIRIGLSSLRIAMAENDVYRPGGYLLSVIRSRNPEFSFSSKGKKKNHGQNHGGHQDRVPSTAYSSHQVPLKPQRPIVFAQPPEPEPPAPTPEDLVKGFRFSAQAIGMERTLSLMERTVEGINVRELWDQVKSLMPDSDPRGIADRFFQVFLTRLKHLESRKKE
jgi:hypothetical protein